MKNKHLVRWLCLLLIVTVAGAAALFTAPKAEAAPAGLVLEDMPIVLPANATDVEKNAAKELQHYLREITGSASSMITESVPVESAIYIGATEFAELNNVTYTDNNGMGEGWTIKAIGNSLVITGGETRGTLYGVYHLLEDELGVRWWNMWEEHVPTMEDAVLPLGFEKSGEPAFAYRDIYSSERPTHLCYVRNRVNGFASNPPAGFGGEIYYGQPYHVHTFNRYFPPFYVEPTSAADPWTPLMNPEGVDWFEAHPEWYAYDSVKGRRVADKQMCLTNEELMSVFADKVILAVELSYELADEAGRERPTYFDVSPNDIDGACECERCLEVLAESGATGRLLRFLNTIAAKVETVYPEVYIESLAYAEYLEVPLDDTVPRQNVVLRLANSDADALHDWNHVTNAHVKSRLADWAEILEPHQMLLWDYDLNYQLNGVFPNYFRIRNDYQMFHELGGTGVFTELENQNESEFWDMKHWMLMKLMENPYQDEYALAMEFLTGYYGEAAADHIMTYLRFWEAIGNAYTEFQVFDDSVINADWLKVDDVITSYGYFEDAQAALENDKSLTEAERELFLNRLEVARGGLDRLILFNYYNYVDEYAARGEVFPLSRHEIGERTIRAIQWLGNMELEEDYTGQQSMPIRKTFGDLSGSYSAFAGETDEKTGEMLERPEIPQQIYDDHPGIDRAHIHDYNYPNFWNATVQGIRDLQVKKNAASYPGGTALLWDQNEIMKNNGALTHYYVVSETKALNGPGLKHYLGDPLVVDGEWHLYRAEDVVVLKEGSTMVSFFADTMRFEVDDLTHLIDEKVDVYYSMKIEGDPTGTDPNNYGKFWIDRVFIVEDCTTHNIKYTSETAATCASNATKTGTCPVCGQQATKEFEGTQLPHDIVGGYTWDEENKVYHATCNTCGDVEYDFLGQLPEDLLQDFAAQGVDLNKVHDFGVDDFDLPTAVQAGTDSTQTIVTDSESLLGKTLRWDVMARSSYGYFVIDENRPWMMGAGASHFNRFYKKDIIVDGDYHLYKLEDVVVNLGGAKTKMFCFDESLRVDFANLAHLVNKRVDIYISFKVEGDLVFVHGAPNTPTYYIDRVLLVEKCNEHLCETYTYNAAAKAYEGICENCGKKVSRDVAGELPQEFMDTLAAMDSNLFHVYDYAVADLNPTTNPYATRFNDPDSAMEESLQLHSAKMSAGQRANEYIFNGNKPMPMTSVVSGKHETVGSISADDLNANSGDGKYHLYRMRGVPIPEGQTSTYIFGGAMTNFFADLKALSLTGNTMDVYLSMKVEGDVTGMSGDSQLPVYYIDRMIVVDLCENYMEGEKVLASKSTCYQGTTYSFHCTACGRTLMQEDIDSRLPHDFGPYVLQSDGKTKVATCRNNGCDATKTVKLDVDLPQRVLDDLAANNIGMEHVYDFDGFDNTFASGVYGSDVSIVEDPESVFGQATLFDLTKPISINRIFAAVKPESGMSLGVLNKGDIGVIPYAELKANADQGYHTYKLEDVTLKVNNTGTLYLFNYAFIRTSETDATVKKLRDKTVDIYINMKIEGSDLGLAGPSASYPKYYVDRWIIVDKCENYEITYTDDGTGTCTTNSNLIGVCPICGSLTTKPGTGAAHKFTNYVRERYDKYTYVAECDYGCGATDIKGDPRLELEDLLPDEMPENVKKHVLFAYDARDITYSKEEGYIWDFDLDRPVVCRDYAHAASDTGKAANNIAQGLPVCWWPQGAYPAFSFGGFGNDGSFVTNANDGKYHLYALKGIKAITLPAYNYMYMFTDWDMQIRMLDEDLEAYRDQLIDFYLYMKIEGDPSCGGANKPKYYIASFYAAQSCQTDETWVVTKEPTCTATGEMVGDCAICGIKGSTVTIPKVPHQVVEGWVYAEPTCRDEKVMRGKCVVCGVTEYMNVPGSELEHVFENYVLQEDGVTEIAYCSLGCGKFDTRTATPSINNPQTPDLPVLDALQPFLSVLGGAAGGSSFGFSDIKESDWYFESVKEAWSNKLINGVTATEFRPNETLTVAQAVKLASAYHEMNYTGDVTLENGSGNWYSSYVDYAVENGIIDRGYASKSTAEMNKAIDRSEFVSIFVKAMDEGSLVGYNHVADNAIPDVKTDDENADAIYKFYRAGILTGSDSKGTFNPTSSIKRSEVAAILSRMYNENVRQAITLK